VDLEIVRRYMDKKFGEKNKSMMEAMQAVARSYERSELQCEAFGLYE